MEIRRIRTEGIHTLFLFVCLLHLIQTQVINLSVKCESDTLNIQCSSGLVIQIQKANFGRLNKDICPPANETNCIAYTSTSIAASICDNLVACSLHATVSVFGDACPGVDKYLFVSHTCIEPVVTESSSITAAINTTLTSPMTTFVVDQQTQLDQESTTKATFTSDISTLSHDTTTYDKQTSESSQDVSTATTYSNDNKISSDSKDKTTNDQQTTKITPDGTTMTSFTSDNQITTNDQDTTTNYQQTSQSSPKTTKLSTSTSDKITPNGEETATTDNQPLETYQETTVDASADTCPCTCDRATTGNATNFISRPRPINGTDTSSAVEIADLVLDKKTLSSAIRKKISARDDRSSATLFGYIGVGVLVSVFTIFLILDFLTIILPKRRQYCGRHRFF